MKAALAEPVDAARLPELDRLAEQVLQHADRLVNNLETSGLATSLHARLDTARAGHSDSLWPP